MATCRECGAKLPFFNSFDDGLCDACGNASMAKAKAAKVERNKDIEEQADALRNTLADIILTTETAPALPIRERLGIVTSEYVVGMHLFRDIAGAFRDVFGGRSATMQKGLKEARETALNELRKEAHALGANAVVAIDLDYSEISGGGKSMLFLVASGTAVSLAKAG